MRIAHVITRMIIGGAQENTLLNCLDLVADHGDEVLLICGPETGPEGDLLGRRSDAGKSDAGNASGAGQGGAKKPGANPDQAEFQIDGVRVRIIDPLRRAIDPRRDWSAARERKASLISA